MRDCRGRHSLGKKTSCRWKKAIQADSSSNEGSRLIQIDEAASFFNKKMLNTRRYIELPVGPANASYSALHHQFSRACHQ